MDISFKSIKLNKKNEYILNYYIVEQKGDAEIKCNIAINMADIELTLIESFVKIIEKGEMIAKREYIGKK